MIWTILLFVSVFAVSPYVSNNPPQGQYHPITELWINESVDWKNLDFYNINKLQCSLLQVNYIQSNLIPYSSNVYDLGSSTRRWRNLFVNIINTNYVSSNLIPNSNKTLDLGSNDNWWRNLYVQNIYTGNVNGQPPLSGSGQINYLAKWTGQYSLGKSSIIDTGSYVKSLIEIRAPKVNISNGIVYPYSNPSALYIATNQGDAISTYTSASGRSAIYAVAGNSNSWAGYFEGGKGVYIQKNLYVSGNVGVGTTSPSEKLEVAGNIKGNNIYPRGNNLYNLGNNNSMWKQAYISKICLNPDCSASIYWDGNQLVIQAPNIVIVKTQ